MVMIDGVQRSKVLATGHSEETMGKAGIIPRCGRAIGGRAERLYRVTAP